MALPPGKKEPSPPGLNMVRPIERPPAALLRLKPPPPVLPAETFRQSSREIYGGGQGYADALRLIGERLDGVAGMGADALTQSFVTENARQNTDRIVDALADLRRENAALRRDINMLLMRPAA
jgi:hypothetical protein